MKELIKNKYVQYSLIAVGVLLILYILYRVFRKTGEEKAIDNEIVNRNKSFADSQYYSFADHLESLFSYVNDDEEAIYEVFANLKTRTDLLMLIKAFGERTFWGGGYMFFNSSLNEVLITKLTTDEVTALNQQLETQNINYYF